jgi:hypothetical protein
MGQGAPQRPQGEGPARPGQRYGGGAPAANGGAPVSRSEDGTDFTKDRPNPIEKLVDAKGRVAASQPERTEPGAVDPFSHITTPTGTTGKNPSDRGSQQSEDSGGTKDVTFRPLSDSWDQGGAAGVLSNLWARVSYYTASDEKYNPPQRGDIGAVGGRGTPSPDAAGGDGGPVPDAVKTVDQPKVGPGSAATARKRQVAGPDVQEPRAIKPVDVRDVATLARMRATSGRSTPEPTGGGTGTPTGPMAGKHLTPGGLGTGMPGSDPTRTPDGSSPDGSSPDGSTDDDDHRP